MQPTLHLFALGVGIGGNVDFSVRVGGNAQILAFLDTNMLVFPTRNSCVGPDHQRDNFASQWNIGSTIQYQPPLLIWLGLTQNHQYM